MASRHFFLLPILLVAAIVLGSPLMVVGQAIGESATPSDPMLHVKPRYYRWHVDPGVEWVEVNTDYAYLDWSIPLEQTALVLVDVWDRHYLKDTEARSEAIIEDNLVPLLKSCRQAGMTVIHAPAPQQALPHPNWIGADIDPAAVPLDSDWPPSEFLSKTGPFKQFRRPVEPRAAELAELRASLKIHPQVHPVGNEPVVATGEELHQLCKRSGILFLFFAGFNTNACILTRDYGTVAMNRRGYEVIVVRDCTTGMESCQSQPSMSQTKGAILFLEMFGQYSVDSTDIRSGLKGP